MKTKQIIEVLRSTPLTAQFSVESFSREIQLSRSRFYTIVKMEYGTTPECLIRRRRLECIIEWIISYPEISTKAKLLDLAKIGFFHDAKPLISAFKLFLGEHPFQSRYRLLDSDDLFCSYNNIINKLWTGLPIEMLSDEHETNIISQQFITT
ncbi:MAG: hypothetical protein IPM69_13590 [Ignavibacteria bacterium]|nr:hypothetical protein [Ignavibacteria bacterium]